VKLSLVTSPVEVMPAASEAAKMRFHTLNRATGNRVMPAISQNRIRATVMMVVWVAMGASRPDADAPRQRCIGGMT
jgi:hypothetical protein